MTRKMNCNLAIFVCIVCLSVLARDVQARQTAGTDAEQNPNLEQLVAELGSNQFSVRQSAMKRLWQTGESSRDKLRRYAQIADPEVASRIKRILELLEMGISPDTDPELAQTIYSFHRANDEQKFSIIHRLRNEGFHRQVMDLVVSVNDSNLRDSLARGVYEEGEDVVTQVLGKGLKEFDLGGNVDDQLRELDELMMHPFMRRTHLRDCVVYWKLRGQLDQRIEQLEEQCRQSDASDDDRRELVRYYRAGQVNYQAAIKAARQLSKGSAREIRQLDLEAGNWQQLAAAYAQHPAARESAAATYIKQMVLHYWAGQQDQLQSLRRTYNDQIFGPKSDEVLMMAHLTTFSTEGVIEQASKIKRSVAFRLLCYMQQYDAAFALASAPDNDEDHQKWFKDLTTTLHSRLKRFENGNQRNDYIESEELYQFCRHYAFYLGSLGETTQAVALFELLIEACRIDDVFHRNWNVEIFSQLCELNIGNDIWHFVEVLNLDSNFNDAVDSLFPLTSSEANAWFTILANEIPEPMERIKFIANLLRSPFADHKPEIDFDLLLELARKQIANHPKTLRARHLMAISETCRAHDRIQEAEDFAMEAGYLGEASAFRRLGDLAADQKNWTDAADWYKQSYRIGESNDVLYKLGIAHRETGEAQLGRQEIFRSRIAELHSFYLSWLSHNVFQQGFEEEAIDLLNTYLSGHDIENDDNYFDFQRFANILKQRDPQRSANHWRIATYLFLGYTDTSAEGTMRLHYLAMEAHQAEARHLINSGEIDQAFEVLQKCARFMSSSTALAEDFVPLLERKGYRQRADQLFQQVANRYLQVLKKFPSSALHNNNYAWACARCGRRIDDAIKYARRAIEIEPANTSYIDTLAEAQFRAGHVEEAIASSQTCIRLNPFKPHYREQLKRFQNANAAPSK